MQLFYNNKKKKIYIEKLCVENVSYSPTGAHKWLLSMVGVSASPSGLMISIGITVYYKLSTCGQSSMRSSSSIDGGRDLTGRRFKGSSYIFTTVKMSLVQKWVKESIVFPYLSEYKLFH